MKIYLVCPDCGSDEMDEVQDAEKSPNEVQKRLHKWPYNYVCLKCHHQFTPGEATGKVMEKDGKTYRIE
jgi:hypothetical protein